MFDTYMQSCYNLNMMKTIRLVCTLNSHVFLLQGGRMGFLEILIIGVGLSMDAFAVSICKGLSTRTLKLKHALICGGYFGFFKA